MRKSGAPSAIMNGLSAFQRYRNARASAGGDEIYRSTKMYDHNEGLSCCFRQWRATDSHCRLIHGYALAFKFVFATFGDGTLNANAVGTQVFEAASTHGVSYTKSH